jgi:hypothetical protein
MKPEWFLERMKQVYAQQRSWDREEICGEVTLEVMEKKAAGRDLNDVSVWREVYDVTHPIETEALCAVERLDGHKLEYVLDAQRSDCLTQTRSNCAPLSILLAGCSIENK